MSNKVIFLSYRRGDSPGYVKTLEEELERHYGKGSVFRDVEDIVGGSKWKQVLENNLRNSSVLLLVVGPRWDSLWRQRIDDKVNYVEWELNLAQELGVPVIPITLDGAMIGADTNLKSVSWLRENQFYDMSDKQGRWDNDFKGLLGILKNVDGLENPKQPQDSQVSKTSKSSSPFKTGTIVVAMAISALVVLGALMPDESDDSTVTMSGAVKVDRQAGSAKVESAAAKPDSQQAQNSPGTKTYPVLEGTWQSSMDGGLYKITHDGGQDLSFFASDYGTFVGRFVEGQPGKIRISLNAGGSGESIF